MGLPREIIVNIKSKRFAMSCLGYLDAIYINVYCVIIMIITLI